MKRKTNLLKFELPESTVFQVKVEAVLCYSPQTEGTSLPGFSGGPVDGYDDDNPYFGN